jgi:ribosomal peptide maturation radical SAM protein 1
MEVPPFDDVPLEAGTTVIVVPPWADINRPALNAHILQACARRLGHPVSVLYANVLLASALGEALYQSIAYAPQAALLGEGIFSAAAFGLESIVERGGEALSTYLRQASSKMKIALTLPDLRELEGFSKSFANALAKWINQHGFKVVGATSTFEQTSASIAVLNAVKAGKAEVITILGGANCDGEMAEGIVSLGARINYIFSGESEQSFGAFITDLANYTPHIYNRVIHASRPVNMDDIPRVDYTEYYTQRAQRLPIRSDMLRNTWLTYETSRGCWWGASRHCTFCGLNASTLAHREKSPAKVVDDLKALLRQHPSDSVWFTDNIMPYNYFKSMLPFLRSQIGKRHIYWDQKSNLNLEKVRILKEAGIAVIQPGIEALSSRLLRQMNKGVTAGQNIRTLRYTRVLDLKETWNILFAFPGDQPEDYEEQISLMRYLHHLHPPTWLARINIDRFSPYFKKADEFGIRNLRPFPAYQYTFPQSANIEKIAYHFYGDFESVMAAGPNDYLKRLCRQFDDWRYKWTLPNTPPPVLHVCRLTDESYLLVDTRGLPDTERVSVISFRQAVLALTDVPVSQLAKTEHAWALRAKVGIMVDDRYVALATANYELLKRFEGLTYRGRDGKSDTFVRSGSTPAPVAVESGVG